MAYDAFISYSSADAGASEAVYRALCDFGLLPFHAPRSIGAGRWLPEIKSALTGDAPPTVVVLASRAAAASRNVRQEVQWARSTSGDREVPILVLELEPDARKLPGLDLDEFECLDLSGRLAGDILDEDTKDEFWLRLHVRSGMESLPTVRNAAQRWSSRLLANDVDFWGGEWRRYFPDRVTADASVVLTARGGSGKSVLAAHFVRHVLATDPQCLPVVVPAQALGDDGLTEIARRIGARSAGVLTEHVARLRKKLGLSVVFVLDALDRVATSGDPDAQSTAVAALAAAGMLVVTCRSEAWQRYEARVGLTEHPVAELTGAVVAETLRTHTRFPQLDLPILRLPIYLDALIRLQNDFVDVPQTETDILQRLWDSYAAEPAADPLELSARRFLIELAGRQLRAMTYEVPLAEVVDEERREGETAPVILALEDRGGLVRRLVGGAARVRLRHDLLDCFGMARLLLDPATGTAYRHEVYARAEQEVGYPVLTQLIRVGVDKGDPRLVREVYTELLRMLDEKRFGDQAMGRAWAATFVLRETFPDVLPLILDTLSGARIPSLAAPGGAGSRLSPSPALTQEVASSLASTFAFLRDWTRSEPERAIPILEDGLYRWQYRRRFVEAISKYRHPDAVAALERFAYRLLDGGEDRGVLGEIAQALGQLRQRSSVEVLGAIASSPDLEIRTRRAAIEARNAITWPHTEPPPEVDEAEIVTYLNPRDEKGDYSDWRVIEEYAGRAYHRLRAGHSSPKLISALIGALDHDHTHVRTSVARCLGLVDQADARAALLAELRETSLPPEVRSACVAALRRQIAAGESAVIRAARAGLVRAAAGQARRAGSSVVADALDAMLDEAGRGERLVVTGGAFQIAAPASLTLRLAGEDEAPAIAPEAAGLVTDADRAAVGPALEAKFRLAEVHVLDPGRVEARMCETTWTEGAGFHTAMRRTAGSSTTMQDALLHRYLRGQASLPGLASVHVLVVSADRHVLMARRGGRSAYAPGRWSVSFEEQLTATDLRGPRPAPIAAAIRGIEEELGVADGSDADHRTVAVAVETMIVNTCFVVLAELRERRDEVERRWQRLPAEDREITQLRWIPAQPDALRQIREEMSDLQLHPTSALRLELLARRIEGSGDPG